MELFFVEINKIVVYLTLVRERRVEFQNFIFDCVTKFDPGVIFGRVIEVSSSWPDKWENQDHRATSISIKVGHFVKILLCTEFIKENIKDVDTTLNKIVICANNNFFALFSEPGQVLLEKGFHFINHVNDVRRNHSFLLSLLLETYRPRINDRLPSQMHRLQIHHTTSRNCCRRSHC